MEFGEGGYIMGRWNHGMRDGHCTVETFRNSLSCITGEYRDDKLNGKAKIQFDDDSSLIGYFKDGVLHGFCRYFDKKGRLTFFGMHRNGKAFGTCWRVIRGGGCVVGRVDEEGKLSGINLAYLYPDFKTAFVGTFKDGVMDFSQVTALTGVTEENGIKVPHFAEPDGRLYRREISSVEVLSTTPTLIDPYETEMVMVKPSTVVGADEGLFSKKSVEPNTVLSFYNGIRLKPDRENEPDWEKNAYKIFDPAIKDGTIDIPPSCWSTASYCASMGHKVNHSFVPNSMFSVFDHPRFGVIPCIVSIHDIMAGEEIFIRYGYELDYAPDWYLDAWEKGEQK